MNSVPIRNSPYPLEHIELMLSLSDQSILSGCIGSKSELIDFSFSASDYGIVTKLSNKDLNNYLNSLVEKWTSDGSLAIYDAIVVQDQ